MKLKPLPTLLAALLSGAAFAATEPEQPLQQLPYTPALDVKAMDRTVDPCDDFYQYSCGGWMKANPIPADQSRWSVYAKMADDNQRYLWGVLQTLSQGGPERNANQAKIGDYFAACMDETALEKAGMAPLQPWLERVAALKDKRELPGLIAALHLATNSGRVAFGFGSGQDFADPTQVIAFAFAGGTSLPERGYYLDQDQRGKALRAKFVAHVQRIFQLLGDSPAAAKAAAQTVLGFETALARASLSPVERRDPHKLANRMTAEQLQALTPSFDWAAYRQALGLKEAGAVNVTEPRFYRQLERELRQRPLAQWQTLLRWQLASTQAALLSKAWVQEDFDFFQRTLNGTPQPQPRWKRCVAAVDMQLGEALGQEFVARNFSPELKAATLKMAEQVQQAMAQRIALLRWMDDATKAKAMEKLRTMVNKVGYPDRWRDYGSYQVDRNDFAGNAQRGFSFEMRRQLAKIGKPLDRGEWLMTPQTVNAYYDAQMNDMNFPAGVLQPPLYDSKIDDAPSYGNTGGTIGHELIHGFDDEGRKFDAAGRLRDWWSAGAGKAFQRRAQCVVDQYAQYPVVDEIKINSKLTLGEDLADLGGLILAHIAWKQQVASMKLEDREGLSPEQRFFVGFAQWDCSHARPEALRVKARTDPHSPGRWRINGVVVNMPEFEKAFACKPGSKMTRPDAERCKVW